MSTLNTAPSLTHEQAIAAFDELAQEMTKVRENFRARVEVALSATPADERVELLMDAGDSYLREIVSTIDSIESLKEDHPTAWNQSVFGAAARRYHQRMQQAILDAAIVALGGRWPGDHE